MKECDNSNRKIHISNNYLTSFRLQPLYPTQSPSLFNKRLYRPQQQPMYVGEKKDFCLWWEKNSNHIASILSYTGSHYV
jgi:hypothetical protein